jgi:uncharacterized protein (UPF0264 family)
MTRLLVSVRNVDEARLAIAGGADLIDLKEPHRGSLGPVAPNVMRDVVELVQGQLPVSAALGELTDWDLNSGKLLPPGLSFVKLGLAGCALRANWPRQWEAALAKLPPWVATVAVVYADWRTAQAPRPSQVLEHSIRLGCRAVLVDTFAKGTSAKRGPALVDCWGISKIEQFVVDVQRGGLWCVLAGSLRLAHLPQILAAKPDWVAIRGAVCGPTREGPLKAALLREFRAAIPSCQMFSSTT